MNQSHQPFFVFRKMTEHKDIYGNSTITKLITIRPKNNINVELRFIHLFNFVPTDIGAGSSSMTGTDAL